MSVAGLTRAVLRLDGSGCSIADVGGKGAGLDRLAAAGFPIPSTFAVTTAAYRDAVASAGLGTWLADLGQRPAPEPRGLAAEVDEIEQTFLGITLGPAVRRGIEAAAEELLAGGPVAVRSSATAEDLGVASFAGQYRTFIRVSDIPGVIDAVKRCWASLWLPAAREYRIRHRIPSAGLAMAAIIQSMIDAEWSGVGFTVDPATDREVMRIEMVPGLGESLVSGRVTPLDFSVRRDTLEIISSDSRVSPRCVEDLARMMLQVEDKLDEPQDIEWATIDDEITLLQARPVTVVGPRSLLDDGFDQPIRSEDEFSPHGVVEMLPDTVSPLLWSINAPMIEHGYRAVVAGLGADPGGHDRPIIGRFRGRAALNLSTLREIADSLPGGSAADVERQFLGRAISADPSHGRKAGIKSLMRARGVRRRLNDDVDLATTACDAIVALEVDLTGLSAWRLSGYRRAVRDLAWRTTAAEVAASSAASAAFRRLEIVLERWLDGSEASAWAQRLTAGTLGRHAAGGRLDRELGEACLRARSAEPAIVGVVGGDPARIAHRLRDIGPAGLRLESDVVAASRRAGSRAVYGGPTWEKAPDLVWQRLHFIAARSVEGRERPDPTEAIAELAVELRSRSSWNLIRIATGQIVDLRLRWIEQLANEAGGALRLRERAKAALLALGGEERRIIEEIARRLVNSGQLQVREDVRYLSDRELSAMLFGAPPPGVADLHWRRTAARRAQAALPLPEVFRGSPGTDADSIPAGRLLSGWPASPGKVEATARVLQSIEEGIRLRQGDVLVATATDPSWTPVIVDASAVVLETGGPLSHAAIVAREFGIPAVLKVRDATRIIVDGEPIEVDGYAGAVLRVSPEEES